MALIKCPECGKEFSDQAQACPICGYPLKETSNTKKDMELTFSDGQSVDVKENILTVFDKSGNEICSDSIQNYTLKFYGVQTPAIGDIYFEVIFSHPDLVYPVVLKAGKKEETFVELGSFCKYMRNHANVSIVKDRKSLSLPSAGFRWKNGRLTIGIISIVLFMLITFQSCAAGLSNALQNNGATSGTSGFLLAIFMLTAGIVGICTKNSTSKIGPIISTVFYWLGSILTIGTGSTYGDLPIWGVISFIFGLVFLLSIINIKER